MKGRIDSRRQQEGSLTAVATYQIKIQGGKAITVASPEEAAIQ